MPLSSAVLLLPVDARALTALTAPSGAEHIDRSIDREDDPRPLTRGLTWVAKGVPIDAAADGRGLRLAPWFSGPGVKLTGYF